MKRRATTGALMPLAEAVARLTADLTPAPPIHVTADAAAGAFLAADARAPADCPIRATASRDGWAVSAHDVAGASPYAPVPLAFCPAWVDSGEALPAGCDTVLPPDAILPSPAEAVCDAAPGEGVIAAGGDAPTGAVLAAAGTRLTPLRAAIIATAGCSAVEVRRPRLRLLSVRRSGAPSPRERSEIPADPLAFLLVAYATAWFGCVVETGSADDLASALATGTADATIVLGGTGFGRNDASADILAGTGTLTAHGIALQPAATAGFGSFAGRPVLLIPGRPEEALACFLALGRPLLARLAGAGDDERTLLPLQRKITSVIGLSEVVFVQRGPDGLLPLGSADLPLHRLALADGAVLVPPDREGYGQGVPVEMIPL